MFSRDGDLPEGFSSNMTHLCGITLPQSEPFTSISTCCQRPVEVSHACFHYCETSRSSSEFSLCVARIVDYNFGSRCNFDVDVGNENGASSGPPHARISLPSDEVLQRIFLGPAVWMIMAAAACLYAWSLMRRRRVRFQCIR